MYEYHYCETTGAETPTGEPWELVKAFEIGGHPRYVWRLDARFHELQEAKHNLREAEDVIFFLIHTISASDEDTEAVAKFLKERLSPTLSALFVNVTREHSANNDEVARGYIHRFLDIKIPLPTLSR